MLKIQSDKKSSKMRITRKKKLKIKPRLRLNILELKNMKCALSKIQENFIFYGNF